jgi:uncharacterized membrane protein YphA (DoxX/SURF4 family)
MDTALWVVQVFLAIAFGMAGFMKATQPKTRLAENMGWVNDFSANNVKVIGVLEVLAAAGLILPMLTNILPVLTPLAAIGLILTMIGAIIVHVRRGENSLLLVNLALLALAAFVAYGRLVAVPVA